jgi:hypothetical protein
MDGRAPRFFLLSYIMKAIATWLVVGLLTIPSAFAQTYRLSTEVQSSFIDITGLFGVPEPASVTQFSYANHRFGLDVYHSFSLQRLGNTIQTIVTPSYRIPLDQKGHWWLRPKADLFYNRPAGGGFIRPGFHVVWQPNAHHLLNVGNWLFLDMREPEQYPRRINGVTHFLSYTHTGAGPRWLFSQESRLLFVNFNQGLKVAGAFQQVQVLHKSTSVYAAANGAYSFYRSDGRQELRWNLAVGKVL